MNTHRPGIAIASLLVALVACEPAKVKPAHSPVAVAVEPPSAVVPPGGAKQFAALVTGAADLSVAWSVVEVGGGTVTATGQYTAPASAGTYHVEAKSNADPAQKALAAVTVPAPVVVTVALSPASAAVDACKTASFTATVTGTSNTAVTWSVQEGAAGGSVTGGVYTAPSTAGTYHVVATSAASPGSSASVPVVVSQRIVSVAVTPPTITVTPSGTAQFTATVTTSCGSFTAAQAVALGAPAGAPGLLQ